MTKEVTANPVGRPTDYKPEYNEQVTKLCRLGAKDKEIANFFDVCEATLNVWKKKEPEFMESMKEGKEVADLTIADSLFNRAKGYKHEAVHFTTHEGEVKETKYMKHYPPDVQSMRLWLINRRPDLFRDKSEIDHNVSVSLEQQLDEIE